MGIITLLNLIGFYEKEVRIYKSLALGIAIMKFSNNNSIKHLNTDKGMFRFTDSPPQTDNSKFPKLRELSIFSKSLAQTSLVAKPDWKECEDIYNLYLFLLV